MEKIFSAAVFSLLLGKAEAAVIYSQPASGGSAGHLSARHGVDGSGFFRLAKP